MAVVLNNLPTSSCCSYRCYTPTGANLCSTTNGVDAGGNGSGVLPRNCFGNFICQTVHFGNISAMVYKMGPYCCNVEEFLNQHFFYKLLGDTSPGFGAYVGLYTVHADAAMFEYGFSLFTFTVFNSCFKFYMNISVDDITV